MKPIAASSHVARLTPSIGKRMTYDFNRPLIDRSNLRLFIAVDADVASNFGEAVGAVEMSNAEYDVRYKKKATTSKMKPPPSHHRIFPGYLVVRKLGTTEEYETWMPDHVFEDVYTADTEFDFSPTKAFSHRQRNFPTRARCSVTVESMQYLTS
jgi:hypothetical protein